MTKRCCHHKVVVFLHLWDEGMGKASYVLRVEILRGPSRNILSLRMFLERFQRQSCKLIDTSIVKGET